MQVVTPRPVQREALRSNQANTQLHTLQFLNFCFTSLHVSSFHHLQDFQAYICSYNTSSGPTLSPTSLISGASICFVNSKPETAWEEEGVHIRHSCFLSCFFKRRTGQKRSDIDR